MSASKPRTIADYIDSAPVPAQKHLREILAILREVAPEATEGIKWGQPVLEEKRILFAVSAHKKHLSFTPTGPALEPFRDRLGDFKTGKDSIQFPYDKPLPADLIREIATYRARDVRENDAKWMY